VRRSSLLLLLWMPFVLSLPVAPAPSGAAALYDPDEGFIRAVRQIEVSPESLAEQGLESEIENFDVVGHSDLGGGGVNADVWAHEEYAYVGVWGGDPRFGIPCPATGVKVVDISDPSDPVVVSVLQNPPLTTAEDVVVQSVDTPSFSGDLAVVGIQRCSGPGFRGLHFFDVSDPTDPVKLGRWRAPPRSIGCHEVDLVQRVDGKVLAGCANPFASLINGTDEVVVVRAGDPTDPRKVGGWKAQDAGLNPFRGTGCDPIGFGHSVRFFHGGASLFASYWDTGTVQLNIGRPSDPAFVGRAKIWPPDEDGDNHSLDFQSGREFINAEDFCVGRRFGSWGEVSVYDRSDPEKPSFESTFSTPNSRSTSHRGIFTVHNTEVVAEDQAFSSWYSDGIQWWEITRSGATFSRGFFVPPPTPDPHGFFPPFPLVWGVYAHSGMDLILASDVNSGLWILDPVRLNDF
jgi:hypothetical protein